ncbi:hypothetical protein BH23VER1_BH23VER1_19350 [soil metagenome]
MTVSISLPRFLPAFLVVLIILLGVPEGRGQEFRIWTASSGHTLDAKLVWWSDDEVALVGRDSTERRVKVDDFTLADQEYLRTQEKLKKKAPPQKLPWVSVSARTKMRGKKTLDGGAVANEIRKRSYFIDVVSKHDEPVEVELVYTYFGESVAGTAPIRRVEDSALYPFDGKVVELTLPPFGEHQMVSDAAQARATRWWGNYRYGSKIAGFVVQVYWNGFLLTGMATDPKLQAKAQDGELLENLSRIKTSD